MVFRLLARIARHKFITAVVLLALAGGGYYWYGHQAASSTQTHYVEAAAEKGTIIVSVSGSGQVTSLNSVDIKAKVSGELASVPVVNGQSLKVGALIAKFDDADAQRSVRDAKTNLETAKLELDKLLAPVDELTLVQAEHSLTQIEEAKQKAKSDLASTYENSFNTVASAFFDLPGVVTGLNDIFFTNTIDKGQSNIDWYANQASQDSRIFEYKGNLIVLYQAARARYDKNLNSYKAASRDSDTATVEALISETYETAKAVADTVKAAHDYISFVIDAKTQHGAPILSIVTSQNSSVNGYISTVNRILSDLISARQSIQNGKDAITADDRSIEEKQLSLAKIKAGPDELDVRAKKIAIQQKEDALLTAEQALMDHTARAPFDGMAAKINVKEKDSVSSGTVLATLITGQKIAEISLNEVDVAKVKEGQKATLTFDAISGLALTGQVAEVALVGTVSQGVVTYAVKIAFDTQDERVKSGMSVSAAVVTDVKQNVLLVPNSSVKSSGDNSYVEMLENGAPRQMQVRTGLSNDTATEIVSGLKEGDKVITQTVTAASSLTQQTSTFRIPGLGGPGGGRN